MADEVHYGDLEDDDILQAATQFSWSQTDYGESPRPTKRRRLSEEASAANTRTGAVKQRGTQTAHISPHQNYAAQFDGSEDLLVSDSEESDAFDPPPANKSTPRLQRPPQVRYQPQIPETGYGTKKAKASIHLPKRTEALTESFSTQPPPSSNPWTIRGPIWQKKSLPLSYKTSAKSPPEDDEVPRSYHAEKENVVQPSQGQERPQFRELKGRHQLALEDERANISELKTKSNIQSGGPVIDIAQELADIPSDAFASPPSSPQRAPENDAIYISSQSKPRAANGTRVVAPLSGLRQKTLFGDTVEQLGPRSQVTKRQNWPSARKDEPPTHHKLDHEALKTWVYPTNLGTIRDYQYNIVHRGLYHNLLVALPTGLGKTFIAATVMLNWLRWTTKAQIVFVAPTKPLVSQQVEACFGIAGIPRSETTMLTGGVSPGLRAEEWNEKRVFFMTPQTIINDLKTGICDPKRIVLLVVDEAHRATGGYAYVEVVKFLRRFNQSFRVLALTATPGSTVEAVQQVIDGLDIARVEIRTENSLDIRQFVHTRNTETVLFDYSDEQEMCMEMFSKALQPLVNQLNSLNAYWGKDPMTLTPYGLTQARVKWMSSDAGRRASFGLKGMVNSIITILARLAHAIELLKFHGIGPFYRSVLAFRNGLEDLPKGSKYQKQVNEHEEFDKMMSRVRGWTNNDEFSGHPKLDYLQNIVLEHFTSAGEGHNGLHKEPPSSTRIMIFAHYRDSAENIAKVLKRHEPMVRPHVFIGQAASKGTEGMDQKRQLEVIQQFKAGVFNTLVATSIGEEGLDIGEVDLIICYDSSSSPIRMLQRMGRTGRKRQGNIVLLLMRGKEENSFVQAKDNYEKMQAMIATGDRFSFHEDRSSRIVPKEHQPIVDKRMVEIPLENTQAELPEPKRRQKAPKRPPKRFNMPDGVRTGFVKASRMDDDQSDDYDELSRSRLQAKTLEDEEQIMNPSLNEVILVPAQEKELERKYTYVYGDDDDIGVKPPRLDVFPRFQRSLRPSKRVGHSRASKRLAETLTAGHNFDKAKAASVAEALHLSDCEPDLADDENFESDQECNYPEQVPQAALQRRSKVPRKNKRSHAAKDQQLQGPEQSQRGRPKKSTRTFEANDDEMEAPESSAPQSSARMRLPSQAVDLGSYDTSGEDAVEGEPSSELRDFVVDDDEQLGTQTSSLPPVSQVTGTNAKERREPVRRHDWGEVDMESDSDLPETVNLVQTRLTDPEMRLGDNVDDARDSADVAQGPKRKRRVVEDSDSE